MKKVAVEETNRAGRHLRFCTLSIRIGKLARLTTIVTRTTCAWNICGSITVRTILVKAAGLRMSAVGQEHGWWVKIRGSSSSSALTISLKMQRISKHLGAWSRKMDASGMSFKSPVRQIQTAERILTSSALTSCGMRQSPATPMRTVSHAIHGRLMCAQECNLQRSTTTLGTQINSLTTHSTSALLW